MKRKSPIKIDLRKNQVVWLRRYARNGGRCFVAVKVGRDYLYVWEGKYALELRKGLDIWGLPHWEFVLMGYGWQLFSKLLEGESL